MVICEPLFNITIGIYILKFQNFMYISNNRIHGRIGKFLQKLIDSRKSMPFNCNLVGELKIGEKLDNNSYDGAIKRIQDKEIDLFLRPASPFLDAESVELTTVTYSETYVTLQTLDEASNLNERDVFLKFFDLRYLIYVLSSLFIFFFIISIIFICKNGGSKILSSLNSVLKLNRNYSKYLLILSISFVIFNFITSQIFLIMIKTEKVVVDTSELLLNEERIFKSKLSIIWVQGEPDKEFFSKSAKDTFLYRLYKSKNYNPPKSVDKADFVKDVNLFESSFLIMNKLAIRVVIYALNNFLNLKLFANVNNPFYTIPNYFYRIKGKNQKTKYIDYATNLEYENGLFDKFFIDVDSLKSVRNKDKNQVYYSAEEYIQSNTIFESISFNNLYYLFSAYLIIMLIILILFIFNHLILFVLKQKKLLQKYCRILRNRIIYLFLNYFNLKKNLILLFFTMFHVISRCFNK